MAEDQYTQEEIWRIAEEVRRAGIPDAFNRWLGITAEQATTRSQTLRAKYKNNRRQSNEQAESNN